MSAERPEVPLGASPALFGELIDAGLDPFDAQLVERKVRARRDVSEVVAVIGRLTALGVGSGHIGLMTSRGDFTVSVTLSSRGVSDQALASLVANGESLDDALGLLGRGVAAEELSALIESVAWEKRMAVDDVALLLDDDLPVDVALEVMALDTSRARLSLMRAGGLPWGDVLAIMHQYSPIPPGWAKLSEPSYVAMTELAPSVRRMAAVLAMASGQSLEMTIPMARLADGTTWADTYVRLQIENASTRPDALMLTARALEDDGPGFDLSPLPRPGWRTPSPALLLHDPAPVALDHPAAAGLDEPALDLWEALVGVGVDPVAAVPFAQRFAGDMWLVSVVEASLRGLDVPLGATYFAWLAAAAARGALVADIEETFALPVFPPVAMSDAVVAAAHGLSPADVRALIDDGGHLADLVVLLMDAGVPRAQAITWSLSDDGWRALNLVSAGVPVERVERLLPVVAGLPVFWSAVPSSPELLEMLADRGLSINDVYSVQARLGLVDDVQLPAVVASMSVDLLSAVRTLAPGSNPDGSVRLPVEGMLMLAVCLADRPWAHEVIAALGAEVGRRNPYALLDAILAERLPETVAPSRSAAVRVQRSPSSPPTGWSRS